MKVQRRLLGLTIICTCFPVIADTLPAGATTIPDAAEIPNRLAIQYFSPDDIVEFKKLDHYSEPSWVTEKYVKTGKLPPVAKRLPEVPMVLKTASMPDGIGEYGGVLRQVIGGRPQGWNWSAAHSQGWGGINYIVQQCLTRTGPMYQLNPDERKVLPNLAQNWEWSDDGMSLTMHLIRGARWSDGEPFTAEDVRFYWEDTVLEPRIPSFSSQNALGKGAKLEVVDPYTIRWHFDAPHQNQALYNMSFMTFCPGPAHILKPLHPKYNPQATYDSFSNALPASQVPVVTMGPWVPVDYKDDQIIVLRRNPYYWKVDEAGHQLPYMDEVHYKLSTWEARTLETMSGKADFSNMENPPIYIETLRKLAAPDSPTKAMFGPRNLAYQIQMNMNLTLAVRDDREAAIRTLNRDLKFRKAISHAVDRKSLGQALVKGPFTAEYAGGLHPETAFYNPKDVVYFPYNPALAKKYLAELGLKDTDGNGVLNFPQNMAGGRDLEIVLNTGNSTSDTVFNENLVSMMADVGIKLIPRVLDSVQGDSARDSGDFDWRLNRSDKELIVPMQRMEWLAPIAQSGPIWHRGTENNPQVLQPFEKQLVELAHAIVLEQDSARQTKLIRQINHEITKNVYHVGLVAYPGALLVNKRIKNVPNAPIIAYQWAEDAVMRERFWVPEAAQTKALKPQLLPEYNK
ncbi:ABC transporter substrate-binding protein [Vibrio mangrovi]|uniref:ABC transporter substrate-binding protein n=1 Tax=Vibrio mangrovi TaxID=474394 RepID=A0A1Y6IVD1_9VIBR|nr:ABC transporter substrate-binding protein [Vibrio mangrovi]MDW6004482.1 ABC transporter substrate-binding protein [Vibrio mangrovi]SMS00770.1 putative ABC transporter-binding protein precursor [Vibrio mangrovi]